MAARKPFLGVIEADPELDELMRSKRGFEVSEQELRQQRISFAYGNAMNAEGVTKESVKAASESLRLRA